MQSVLLCLFASCLVARGQKAAAPPTVASEYIVSAHASSIPSAPPARPVARVNGAVLTDHDLLREMYTIFPYARQHNGSFPKEMEPDIRRGALKMIEFEELVYQEASRRHLAIAPARLASSEKQFRERFENDQQYQYFLQTEANGSQQVVRTKIKRSLLIEDFLKEEVTDRSAVSEAEAKAFYLQNPDRFKMPESYALQTITVLPPQTPGAKQAAPGALNPEIEKQMRARAEDALKQAKASKNYEEFGVLAEKISEDDYRVMMGDHRAVNTADLPAPILAVISKLQPGQVSDLIRVEGAYTIVRLNAHSPARMQSFAEVEKALRAQMQQSKEERLRRELDARLRKTAKIEEL
jgi:parvulin-like peptidyl-prolyl isomerase